MRQKEKNGNGVLRNQATIKNKKKKKTKNNTVKQKRIRDTKYTLSFT